MESELDFQKICPKCSRVYKTETNYCRDCGIELETREPSSIQTDSPQVISESQTIDIQTSSTFVGEESKSITCKNCGAMILAESWRVVCPNCGQNMYKKKKTQSKISGANRGFLIAFAFFMGISTSLYYFSVNLPLWQALVDGLILGFIFGDLTRNIINFPKKGETRKHFSVAFWSCFILFGLIFWGVFTIILGPFWGVIAGWGIGLICGLGGVFLALLGFG